MFCIKICFLEPDPVGAKTFYLEPEPKKIPWGGAKEKRFGSATLVQKKKFCVFFDSIAEPGSPGFGSKIFLTRIWILLTHKHLKKNKKIWINTPENSLKIKSFSNIWLQFSIKTTVRIQINDDIDPDPEN